MLSNHLKIANPDVYERKQILIDNFEQIVVDWCY